MDPRAQLSGEEKFAPLSELAQMTTDEFRTFMNMATPSKLFPSLGNPVRRRHLVLMVEDSNQTKARIALTPPPTTTPDGVRDEV